MGISIVCTIGALLYWLFIYLPQQKARKIEEEYQLELKNIKALYDEALKGNDKKEALSLGREYYSKLRRGNLTIYDEQAITNDLHTLTTNENAEDKIMTESSSRIEKLEKLALLRTQGILTDSEFEAEKDKIMK